MTSCVHFELALLCLVASSLKCYMSFLNFHPCIHNAVAQVGVSSFQIPIVVDNFQEVETGNESTNIVTYSFDLLNNDSQNGSLGLNRSDSIIQIYDVIHLQWETAVSSSRGLIPIKAENVHLRQGYNASEGAARYQFTVKTTDFGEGPLLLTLIVKLQCSSYPYSYCNNHSYLLSKQSLTWYCTCSSWKYLGESETIFVGAKRGE